MEIRDNQTNVGRLTDGRLQGIRCTILVADQEHVTIVAEPDSATNWTRVVFRVSGKGKATVRLFWVEV